MNNTPMYEIFQTVMQDAVNRKLQKKFNDALLELKDKITLEKYLVVSKVFENQCYNAKISLKLYQCKTTIKPSLDNIVPRKRRKVIETIDNDDMDKYIQAILVPIDNNMFLLDQNNILYSCNGVNNILGRLTDDNKVEWVNTSC